MARTSVLALCGSSRKESYNRKLVFHARDILQMLECDVEFIELKDLTLPLYDADLEQNSGMPAGAGKLAQAILDHDALLIGNPEYNGGITGNLKNAIDWASRNKVNPFAAKTVLLVGTSPGWFGAIKSHLITRQILTTLRAVVVPTQVTIPLAEKNIGVEGKLVDPAHASLLKNACAELVHFSQALRK